MSITIDDLWDVWYYINIIIKNQGRYTVNKEELHQVRRGRNNYLRSINATKHPSSFDKNNVHGSSYYKYLVDLRLRFSRWYYE